MSSPFDEPDDAPNAPPPDPAAERRRRYALIRKRTLIAGMVALISLVWLRELLGLAPAATWLPALVILVVVIGVYFNANEESHQRRLEAREQEQRRLREQQQQRERVAEEQRALAERHRALAERYDALREENRACSDCGGEVTRVMLLGNQGFPIRCGEMPTTGSAYTNPVNPLGEVHAERCNDCGQIRVSSLSFDGLS